MNPNNVMVLHGFTSSLDCVKGVADALKERGFNVCTPLLRGHGTHYRDLVGVRAEHWYEDALSCLKEMGGGAVVGLSMGGLVALDLGIREPELTDSVVAVAAALRFADPLARFSKYLGRVIPYWWAPNAFNSPELRKERNTNYRYFPVLTFASLYDYASEVQSRLHELTRPLLVVHSTADKVIPPKAAQIIYETARSEEKSIEWFHRSGHEMFLDMEAAEVIDRVVSFLEERRSRGAGSQASGA